MKRDLDLVRKILFAMEEDEYQTSIDAERLPKIEGYNEIQILYHVNLMAQAGLIHIDKIEIPTMQDQKFEYNSYSISWNGHEFIDAARNDTFWKRAKDDTAKALGVGGGAVFPVLMELLTSYLKAKLNLP
jgi:Hypothetical protein (DUF2513)